MLEAPVIQLPGAFPSQPAVAVLSDQMGMYEVVSIEQFCSDGRWQKAQALALELLASWLTHSTHGKILPGGAGVGSLTASVIPRMFRCRIAQSGGALRAKRYERHH
jgi:hypothetical protein